MTSPATIRLRPHHAHGFTLVELLVSLAVALILLTLVASMVSVAANMTTTIHNRLFAFHDANLALDYLAQDLGAIVPPSQSSTTGSVQNQTTLTIYPDTVNGVSTWWIMCLSRPRGTTTPGAVAAVSYRMAYQDPNQSTTGSTKSFALYRSVITTVGSSPSFFYQPDLYLGYWQTEWTTYAPSNIVPVDDYLLGNVVGITIKLNYRYYTSSTDTTGTVVSVPLTSLPNHQVNLTNAGFVVANISGADIPQAQMPNVPLSVDMVFTILRAHGAALYQAQAGPWSALSYAISHDSISISRNFPILNGPVD